MRNSKAVNVGGFDVLQYENDRGREVVNEHKFTQRLSASPDLDRCRAGLFRFVKFPHQSRYHVRRMKVEIIVRAVKIRRHYAKKIPAVLPVIALTQLYSGDLCDGI